jgi:serine/threonine-protein kinase
MTGDGDQTDRARAREALIGRTVAGRYVVRALLGAGGMGAVYEAEHTGLGKPVAIKFVDSEFVSDEHVVARFAREARVMSRLDSAHVVTIFDTGSEDGRPFLVMELLRGEDLGNRLRRTRTVPRDEALHVIAQVLKGLARAHAAGIVHRDLKPDNVFLLSKDGDASFAKIVDFGVSKIDRPRAGTTPLALTGRGTVIGTPFYMAPEQAQAASDVDGRADLYSVGAILFECLTGRPPHTGESYEQVILSICMREAPDVRAVDPTISAELAAFVARALARNKDVRFGSAEVMLAALHEVAPAERARVPLDPVTSGTLLSGGGIASGGGAASASAPEGPSVATRVGVASLDRGAGEVLVPSSERASSRSASAAASAPSSSPRASAPSVPSVAASPRAFDRSLLLTAGFATIAGVGVTLAVIHVLGGRGAEGEETPRAVPTSSTAPPPEVTSRADASPAATALAPETSLPRDASAASTDATRDGGRATPSATRGSAPARPAPPRKLDIQRDLP